jgi:hypothetical protein
MENFPAGSYFVGHVSVQNLSQLAGITNVNQLSGCFDLSNQLAVVSNAVNGGTISTAKSTTVCGDDGIPSVISFSVSGQAGNTFRWVALNQAGTIVLASNNSGIFDFDLLGPGTYRVVHAAARGVNLGTVDPQNVPPCVDGSNLIIVTVTSCAPAATLSSQPNPTRDISYVEFTVPTEETALLEVFDLAGRLIETIYNSSAQAGVVYRHDFNGSNLPNGVYLYRLTTDHELLIEKFMIAR